MRSRSRLRPYRPPVARPRPVSGREAVDEAAADSTPPLPFDALPLSEPVLAAIGDLGYTVATPIQALAIPPILEGRDVIGQAHTGSGKTAAFGIPIVERIDVDNFGVQALILCPTRELAVQVHEELEQLGGRRGVRSLAVYGGDSMGRQLTALRSGAHVVVATPGRLLDHLARRSLTLAAIGVVVLDEADRMLDMGFAPDVERILRQCPQPRQTLLFSATIPEWVRRLSAGHMRHPLTLSVAQRMEIAPRVRQYYVQTTWAEKFDTLCRLLENPDVGMALVFCETKRNADLLEAQLGRRGYRVALLHGDLSQRERDEAMRRFRDNHVRYLVATNVAARGLDIDDITHVVNYDVPATPEDYLHRVGRTGRAGREGVAVTLITPSEILKLRDVERAARTIIEPAPDDLLAPVEAATA